MDNPATTRSVSALTQAIARGDSSAFARFYDQWFERLVQFARSGTGRDESFCLDVVQDAMIRIMQSMKRFDDPDAFEVWLRVIVWRCALDRLRAERRRARRESLHARAAQASARDPDAADERLAWLSSQLAELDQQRSVLIAMRYRLGATLEQIGRVVGLRPGAVDGRINRSLSRITRAARETLDEP